MKKTFSLLLAAAACVIPFTLSSCGGGGDSGEFCVTSKEFASGSKAFYISAMNLWTARATDLAGDIILSGPDKYKGTVVCNGEITTGAYDKHDAGIAKVQFHYTYNADENTGVLSWSWDSADPKNAPTAALTYITTVHNYPGGGNGEEGYGGQMEGTGTGGDPVSQAEHYGQMHIDFDFKTGDCVLHCACGSMSQHLHFDIRKVN